MEAEAVDELKVSVQRLKIQKGRFAIFAELHPENGKLNAYRLDGKDEFKFISSTPDHAIAVCELITEAAKLVKEGAFQAKFKRGV